MTATADGRVRNLISTTRSRGALLVSSRTARGGFLLLVASTVLNLSTFVFHIAQTRILGPSRYGELGALVNVVTVLTLPLSAIEAAVAQMVATHTARAESVALRRTVIWWLPVALASAAVVALLSPLIARGLRINSFWTVALLAVWLGPAMFAAVLQGALIGERRLRPVAVTIVAGAATRVLLGVALAEAGLGVAGAFTGVVLSGVVMCAVLWVVVGPQIRSHEDGPRVNASDVLRSASSIGGVTVMISLDVWMARHFLSSREAGIYAAASTLGKIPMFLPGAVYLIAFPRMASHEGRGPQARSVLAHAVIFVGVLGILGAAFLMGLARPAVDLLFDRNYTTAAHPLMLLAWADGAAGVSTMFVFFLMARRTRLALAGWGGCLAALLLVLIRHGSIEAIAWDMLIANVATLGFVGAASLALISGDIQHERAAQPGVAVAEPAVGVPGGGRTGWIRTGIVVFACVGITAVVPLAFISRASVKAPFADVAVASLLIAVCLGIAHILSRVRVSGPANEAASAPITSFTGRRTSSKWWALVVFVVAVVAASSWFDAGTVFAGGDIYPPNGLAWISHLFDPWVWSGSDLGGPNSYQVQLPWAVMLEVVSHLGGSAGLAQAVWYSGLFAGAGVAAFGLLRLLKIAPPAACVGALAYMFNPYTLSFVNNNPVYLAAMCVLAVLGCIVLAVGTGRIRIRVGVVLVALTAPFIGYVYENPPTVMLLVFGTLIAGVGAAAVGGRAAVSRCLRLGAIAVPVLLLVSAYWLAPALIQAHVGANGQLATVASWSWTEVRATLANALWLNNEWSWKYAYYYPYAAGYAHLPLALFKYLLPLLAFGALPLTFARKRNPQTMRNVVVLFAAIALLFIVLSTGTRAPGDVLFDRLYALPDGWLLREPGRFLLGSALAYSVLVAVSIEVLSGEIAAWPRTKHLSRGRRAWWPLAVTLLIAAAVIVPAYPLVFGQTVPTKPPGDGLPGEHVHFPAYWDQMASYLNGSAPAGTVLMLPPDTFYQVPYTWGYRGAEAFIPDLIKRPVVDTAVQGYFTVSAQMVTAVNRLAQDVLAHRWDAVNDLASTLDTPYIMVRGDVDLRGNGGASIISPARLAAGLAKDPDARLVHTTGPLELYRLRPPAPTTNVVTDTSVAPNLEALSLFSAGTSIIQSKPRPGMAAITQAPSFSRWTLVGSSLQTTVKPPSGRSYRVESVLTWADGSERASTALPAVVHSTATASGVHFSIALAPTLIRNGDFSQGNWERSAHDCERPVPGSRSSGTVERGAGPAGVSMLRLEAESALACEYAPVQLSSGPLLVSLHVRHVSGGSAQVCLWADPHKACVATPVSLSDKPGWRTYNLVMNAPANAKKLRLEIYSAASSSGGATVNDFADVSVHPLDETHSPVIISASTIRAAKPAHLIQTVDTAGSQWTGPKGDERVVVDGMRNGWIGSGSANDVRYTYASEVHHAYLASIIGILITLGTALWSVLTWLRPKRRPPADAASGLPYE